jgi:hypothetical protein
MVAAAQGSGGYERCGGGCTGQWWLWAATAMEGAAAVQDGAAAAQDGAIAARMRRWLRSVVVLEDVGWSSTEVEQRGRHGGARSVRRRERWKTNKKEEKIEPSWLYKD